MNVKNTLIQLADNDYKEFNSKLCPDTKRQMLGIRVPRNKKACKRVN